MSGVLLRCPHCGTSRSTPGECDACHEEQVRYFCTNHTPGVWLEGPTCTRCGAMFGRAAAAPPFTPRKGPPAAEEAPRRPRSGTPRYGEGHFGRGAAPAGPAPAPTSWKEAMAAARARAERETEAVAPDPSLVARGIGGCLLRLVVMIFVLVLLLVSSVVLFTGSMFRVW